MVGVFRTEYRMAYIGETSINLNRKKKLYQHSVDLLYKFERTKSSSDHYHYLINASFIRRENDSLRHNALKVH